MVARDVHTVGVTGFESVAPTIDGCVSRNHGIPRNEALALEVLLTEHSRKTQKADAGNGKPDSAYTKPHSADEIADSASRAS